MTRNIVITTFLAATLFSAIATADRVPRRVKLRRMPATSITMRNKMAVERRMGLHIKRINVGIGDGSLTWREARTLYRNVENVDKRLARYLRDRRISGREVAKLNRLLDRSAAQIRVLRRNRAGRALGPVPIPVTLQRLDRRRTPKRRTISAPRRSPKRVPIPVTAGRFI